MSGDAGVLVRAEAVSKKFCRNLRRSLWYGVQDTAADLIGKCGASTLRPQEFWAVDDISFELRRGECLGLIGRNGAGKTTLLKMLNGLVKPDRGRIEVRGRVGALIALGAGFNPLLTGRENIYVNGAVLGLGKREIGAKFDEIVDFAEIGEFIDTPVQSYSSGMQVRLGFAVATAMNPDVLLLDEVLAVGDASFHAKCFQRIGSMMARAAVIFVSHQEYLLNRICKDALLLSKGRIVFHGPVGEAIATYRNGEGRDRVDTSLVKDQRICSCDCTIAASTVGWGGKIDMRLGLRVSSPIAIGYVLVHFWQNGGFVCNGEVTYPHDAPLIVLPGGGNINAELGPMYLANGSYSVTVHVLDETRKRTLLHWLHVEEFRVAGPVGCGPPHLVPLKLVAG